MFKKIVKVLIVMLIVLTMVISPFSVYAVTGDTCTNNDNHSMACGGIGKWFNSNEEIEEYWLNIRQKWGTLFEQNEELLDKLYTKLINFKPDGYESWSCAYCGKWTGNFKYNNYNFDVNGGNKDCTHNWDIDNIDIKDSTCTKTGKITFTCLNCGGKSVVIIDELKPHSFVYSPNDNRTHTVTCENCDYNEVDDCSLVKGKTVAPTCTSKGYTNYTCEKCNATYKDDVKEKKAHSFLYSYNGNDTHTVTCENCNYNKVEPCEYVKDEKFVECTKCGEKHANDCVHEWDSGQITQEPTCDKEGIKTFTCRICQATRTEKINKKPHSFLYDYSFMECHNVTCENCDYSELEPCDLYADGEYVECAKCGERHETDCDAYTNSGSHFWGNEYYGYDFSEIIKESTCTENGIKLYHCGLCGAKKAEELDKKPHTYELTTVQPTCTNDGYIANSCIYCGELYIDDNYKKIPAQGHDFGEVVYAKEPTYFEDGNIEYKVCKKCGKNFHTNADTFAADDTAIADVTIPRLVNLGDVNGDGNINPLDVLIVKRYIAGFDDAKLDGDMFARADVSGDGKVNPLDALAIMQKIAGIIDSFDEIM